MGLGLKRHAEFLRFDKAFLKIISLGSKSSVLFIHIVVGLGEGIDLKLVLSDLLLEFRAVTEVVSVTIAEAFNLSQLTVALGLKSGNFFVKVGVLLDEISNLRFPSIVLCVDIAVHILQVLYLQQLARDFGSETSVLL